MEVVICILAAEDEELEAIGESINPLDEWSGIETPGLDTVKIATLHCLLTGETLQASLDVCEPVYVGANQTIVVRIPDDSFEKLATLDEQALEDVAGELAATDEFEKQEWSAESVLALLSELAELAQLAESQGQGLFVWIALRQP
jgi:hypothetical protein